MKPLSLEHLLRMRFAMIVKVVAISVSLALVARRGLITTRRGADESLVEDFPNQIRYTDWPVEPAQLGELAISVVRNCLAGSESAARAYVEIWTQASRTKVA